MIFEFCGRSGHHKMSLSEMIDVVRHGAVTETPQLLSSYETCVELRHRRFDETNILTGARLKVA